MTPLDESLVTIWSEVERLLGKCILRLQAFEVMTKAIVASHRFSAPVADLEEAQAIRAAQTQRKTLGTLVGQMVGSYLVAEGQEGLLEEREDAPSVAFMQQIVFPAEDFARIEADLSELVKLRNTLVHHFLDQHDLRTAEGCHVARQTLSAALDQIQSACDNLYRWAVEMKQFRKIMADHLGSPEIRDFIVHGRVPWPIAKITQALLEAATELAPGDWASVDAATLWINQHYPEEQPRGYGCRSWRQVIHEAGLFDLQVRKTDGHRRSWYRARNRAPTQI